MKKAIFTQNSLWENWNFRLSQDQILPMRKIWNQTVVVNKIKSLIVVDLPTGWVKKKFMRLARQGRRETARAPGWLWIEPPAPRAPEDFADHAFFLSDHAHLCTGKRA